MSGSNPADLRKGEQAISDDSRDQDKATKGAKKRKPSGRPADVGRALRSVYDDTLHEQIPTDLSDLLSRLD